MSDPDVRWKQRFDSYQKALAQLTKFIDKENLNELEEQGLIQAFEYDQRAQSNQPYLQPRRCQRDCNQHQKAVFCAVCCTAKEDAGHLR